jgi:hypothetical protein
MEDSDMTNQNKIQLNLSIPETYRNLLRRMAAERVLSDPREVVTGASIATELLVTALKSISGEKTSEGVSDHD